jgi:hypothetical protein
MQSSGTVLNNSDPQPLLEGRPSRGINTDITVQARQHQMLKPLFGNVLRELWNQERIK